MLIRLMLIIFFASIPLLVLAEQVIIGHFSEGDIKHWKNKSIHGITEYILETHHNQTVICATADATSSAFGIKYKVDPRKIKYLHWSWKIESPLPMLNEKLKGGHDFAARLSIIDRRGLTGMKSHVINYVHSSSQAKNSTWANPFNKRAINIAVQSSEVNEIGYTVFKRNIADDFKQIFGEIPDEIEGIAIVTDADNSGAKAKACYGNIWFSS